MTSNAMDPMEAFLLVRQSILKIKDNGVLLGHCVNWQDDLLMEERLFPVFEALKRAMQQNKDSKVSCGGWVSVIEQDKKFKLQIRKKESDSFAEFDFLHLPSKTIIEEYCDPASYGDIKKQQTIFDLNVRSAFENSANNFRFSAEYEEKHKKPQKKKTKTLNSKTQKEDTSHLPSKLNFLEEIQHMIQNSLTNGQKIELVPYKLNVYQRGGFFKSHVDTPTDPKKMIGTLVICLPSFHQGGALVVRHKKSTEVYDFSKYSMDPSRIQWAALFSDCAHEVQPVTEGYRITVTYSIMTVDETDNKANIQSSSSKSDKEFVDLMNQIKQCSVKELGIFLSHNYTLSAAEARNLKGLDKTLVDIASSQNLECIVLPIIHYVHEIKDEDDLGGEMTSEVYAFTHADIKYLTGQGPLPSHDEVGEDIPFIITKSKGDLLQEHETGSENQGNWVEPGEVDRLYFNCAVIIKNKHAKEELRSKNMNHEENVNNNNNTANTNGSSEDNSNNNTSKKQALKRKLLAKKK